MLTRLQEYRDRRKNKIAKEVEKQVEKRVVEAKKEGYQEGYNAAKSESGSHGKIKKASFDSVSVGNLYESAAFLLQLCDLDDPGGCFLVS